VQKKISSLFLIFALFGIFSLGFLGFNQDVYAHTIGFQNQYAPDKWELTRTNSDGSVDTSGAPDFIKLIGGDNQGGLPGDTDYKMRFKIPCDGTIKFDWIFDGEEVTGASGPLYDPSGYLINGGFHQVTNNFGSEVQSGSVTVPVSKGDLFGFRIHSIDNIIGPGIFVKLYNFQALYCNIDGMIDEEFLSNPHELNMDLETAKNIAIGINEHWPGFSHNLEQFWHKCTCKESDIPSDWESSSILLYPLLAYYHPGAAVEYRSPHVTGYSIPNHLEAQHGQQCTFDEFGDLIAILGNSGSGTPDFWTPEADLTNHHAVDVDTYEEYQAVGLVGENHATWIPSGVNLPCTHFGRDIQTLIVLSTQYNFGYGPKQVGPLGEALFLLKDDNTENDKNICGKLGAFINHVDATNKINDDVRKKELIDATNAIKASMGCK